MPTIAATVMAHAERAHRAMSCIWMRRLGDIEVPPNYQAQRRAAALQHAGAPALVCALGSAARGRALYAGPGEFLRKSGHPEVSEHCSRTRLANDTPEPSAAGSNCRS